jgi:peptide/nickel transport system permease protein
MAKYFFRRLSLAIPTLLVVTLLTNAMLSLIPGDPSKVALGTAWTEETGKQYLIDLGLDRPLPVRYFNWLVNAVQLDFGVSYYDKGPVLDRITRAFPQSIQLVLMIVLLSLLISIPVGIYAAYRAGSRVDRIINSVCFGALAVPGFVAGLLIILLLGLKLKYGDDKYVFLVDYVPFFENPFQSVRSLFLPALSVALGQAASFVRIIRTDMATTLQDDFVLMAKSKGMSDKYILFRHAFRPSSFTLLTVAGISIGQLLGGLVITEQLFGLNGIGTEIFRSILQRDYATTLGAVTVVTVVFVLIATVVDMMYGVVDPRVRQARKLG